MNPAYWTKALYAGLAAGQIAFVASVLPDSPGGTATTVNEAILIGVGMLLAGLGTYVFPNKPDPTEVR